LAASQVAEPDGMAREDVELVRTVFLAMTAGGILLLLAFHSMADAGARALCRGWLTGILEG
jgi:hypothetical protein